MTLFIGNNSFYLYKLRISLPTNYSFQPFTCKTTMEYCCCDIILIIEVLDNPKTIILRICVINFILKILNKK